MTVAAGPFAISTTLLVLGGLLKAARPGDTARALRSAGISFAGSGLVRVAGVIEACVGLWALVIADRWSAVAVAVSYAGFAGFVGVALIRDLPISSCGCFGKADTPPSAAHLVVNAGAVVAAVAMAFDPGGGVVDVLADQPVAGVGFGIVVATGVLLTFSALTDLPKVLTPTVLERSDPGARA